MALGTVSSAASWPPVTVSDRERDRLVQTVKDWTIAHGLTVRPHPDLVSSAGAADLGGVLADPVAVTLFPSPFPRSCFEEAKSIQKAYNELYSAVIRDEAFLEGLAKEVAKGDDEFIEKLWDVHVKVKKEGYVQNLSLGLFRSDYMVDHGVHGDGETKLQIKQVEFNTIASSFGGLSSKTSQLHRFLATTEYPLLENCSADTVSSIPPNASAAALAAGLKAAFDAYGPSELGRPTCVLFLVQDGERNVFDQRHLEYELVALGVPVFRVPFSEVLACTTFAPLSERRQLLYTLPGSPANKVFEVAVAYFRAGYGPGDYREGSAAWETRHHLERSAAIKCPTVLTQLAGMKKVQQVLATPEGSGSSGWSSSSPTSRAASDTLRRFAPRDEAMVLGLQRTFTNIFPLDDTPGGLAGRGLATDSQKCKRYVMKPQREGGGNNFYRTAIPAHLKTIPEAHWGSFILMELITPPPACNMILRNGKLEEGGVISELGVYGTCLWDQASGAVLHNEEAGYLLRTKGDQSDEGGVAAGYGCMDSCCLV